MTYLSKILAGLVLVLGLVSVASAATMTLSNDSFAAYQSDTAEPAEGEAEGEAEGAGEGKEKKKKKGEAEPDCE